MGWFYSTPILFYYFLVVFALTKYSWSLQKLWAIFLRFVWMSRSLDSIFSGNVCEYSYEITVLLPPLWYFYSCASSSLSLSFSHFLLYFTRYDVGLWALFLLSTISANVYLYQWRACTEANNNNNCNNKRWCVFCICLVWHNRVSRNFLVFSAISLHFMPDFILPFSFSISHTVHTFMRTKYLSHRVYNFNVYIDRLTYRVEKRFRFVRSSYYLGVDAWKTINYSKVF